MNLIHFYDDLPQSNADSSILSHAQSLRQAYESAMVDGSWYSLHKLRMFLSSQ